MKKKFVYDIEVLKYPSEVPGGWRNPSAMCFGTGVVYDYANDIYRFFMPHEKQEMIDLMRGGIAISFNGVGFDNKVLFGNDYTETGWDDCDLLLQVIKGRYGVNSIEEAEEKHGATKVHNGDIGLDGLAEGTFGMNKTGHGSEAPGMIADGEWGEVYEYNLHDVRLTCKLYNYAEMHKRLYDREVNIVPVDFA